MVSSVLSHHLSSIPMGSLTVEMALYRGMYVEKLDGLRNEGDTDESFVCRSEECDDSNLMDDDGCSKKCQKETDFNCKGELL